MQTFQTIWGTLFEAVGLSIYGEFHDKGSPAKHGSTPFHCGKGYVVNGCKTLFF